MPVDCRVPGAVLPEDLITYDEAIRISECANNLRDRSLFQSKIDAGCRIGEILTARIGEVHFNDAGAVLYSDGKTGYKPIILTWAAKTLAQWLNIHPFRNNKDAPVFCLLNRRTPVQMTYSAAVSAFQKCVKKSGCTKRVWLHLLRHVSCTEDSVRGMSDSYRKYKYHWSPNSRMPAVYEHLSQSIIPKIQNQSWEMYTGQSRTAEHEEEPVQVLKSCRRCEFENPRDAQFCNRCAFALDGKAGELAITQAKLELLNKLIKDPEKLEKLLSLIAL